MLFVCLFICRKFLGKSLACHVFRWFRNEANYTCTRNGLKYHTWNVTDGENQRKMATFSMLNFLAKYRPPLPKYSAKNPPSRVLKFEHIWTGGSMFGGLRPWTLSFSINGPIGFKHMGWEVGWRPGSLRATSLGSQPAFLANIAVYGWPAQGNRPDQFLSHFICLEHHFICNFLRLGRWWWWGLLM